LICHLCFAFDLIFSQTLFLEKILRVSHFFEEKLSLFEMNAVKQVLLNHDLMRLVVSYNLNGKRGMNRDSILPAEFMKIMSETGYNKKEKRDAIYRLLYSRNRCKKYDGRRSHHSLDYYLRMKDLRDAMLAPLYCDKIVCQIVLQKDMGGYVDSSLRTQKEIKQIATNTYAQEYYFPYYSFVIEIECVRFADTGEWNEQGQWWRIITIGLLQSGHYEHNKHFSIFYIIVITCFHAG
jgi:hypothetical protein